MKYQGSCHCGDISFTAEGDLQQVVECNCSYCGRKGHLMWFVGRDKLSVALKGTVATYRFNKHVIDHQFCPRCGVGVFGLGKMPDGTPMAAINARCLENVDLAAVKHSFYDGRSV
ncbi:GFA family protein [Herbaspirillum robiniae]|uniref:GFA family protein n=1 Tax=Herbaspirillum robiniae TaxID=2014887 RepID=UPI003D781E2D